LNSGVRRKLIDLLKRVPRSMGFDIVRYPPHHVSIPQTTDPDIADIIRKVLPFTMSSPERVAALCEAVQYLVSRQIPGDIVECGVWKGGSMMAVAYTLLRLQDFSRDLYLYDTFDGMPAPTERDVSFRGISAQDMMKSSTREDRGRDSVWCYAPLNEVKQALNTVGYNQHQIHYIDGKVEETIPDRAPEQISLLRLDTDWYESTRHELIHLFPLISNGGVIIIDDYGHWLGARQAVDEYIRENNVRLLLNKIDYTGRIGVVVK
jgi:O-methyltransferase